MLGTRKKDLASRRPRNQRSRGTPPPKKETLYVVRRRTGLAVSLLTPAEAVQLPSPVQQVPDRVRACGLPGRTSRTGSAALSLSTASSGGSRSVKSGTRTKGS